MKPIFAFDLDSTVTKCELLPLLARRVGLEAEMAHLTERAMASALPFEESFRARAALLRSLPLSEARAIAADAALNEKIAGFIRENSSRCVILSGNLDVWIAPILQRLGMEGRCFCSRALASGDRLLDVDFVLDKGWACQRLPRPFVAVGDGSNDIAMLRTADWGIAFGGVRKPSSAVVAAADMLAEDESALLEALQKRL